MKNLFLLFALVTFSNAFAQETLLHCFTTEKFKADILKNPEYEKNLADLEDFTTQYKNNARVQHTGTRQIYVIPVVFHILHQYGPENISDAQVIDAVNIMTRDFRKLNDDTVDIVPAFKSIAADCEIEFRLATIDPNGNCTNGIERIYTDKTYNADDDSKLNPWPNNKYLNIWTAYSLGLSGAAAYAQYPGGWSLTDGVMSLANYVGSIGYSSLFHSRVLTHEVGHYLNLSHVWGSNNSPGVACGDDNVSDTPISIGWNQCILTGAYCNPPIVENVQNYMEYSYCDKMFTQGQKTRMLATLNSPIGGRNNLWTSTNLIATGTDGSTAAICIPTADFTVATFYSCAGSPVQYIDQSWNAPVTSWNWSFPGGNPATSIDSAPLVYYSAAGIYNATLVVTSAGGTDSITKNSTVRITAAPMRTMPFTEDFEDSASFPGIDGWVDNPDNSISGTWTRVSNANTTAGGSHSIKINNYNNTAGEVDSWITPSIDFINVSYPINVSFKVANAQRNNSSTDELRLYYSINCGQTWSSTGFNKSGAVLSTSGILTSNFTPVNAGQWRLENVNTNPVQNKANVRFKFQNTSDRGNNIYIDDINITGNIVGIDEADELQTGFALYPNPSYGTSMVSFSLNKNGNVVIGVKNILGQTLVTIPDKNLSSGTHEYTLPFLTPGIYLVEVTVNNKRFVRRLVVS